MQLTREEAVLIGLELRKFVNTDSFEKTIDVLKEQYRQMVFNSDPEQAQEREMAYQQARALDELIITFNTFISMAETDQFETDEPQIFE